MCAFCEEGREAVCPRHGHLPRHSYYALWFVEDPPTPREAEFARDEEWWREQQRVGVRGL